MGFYVYAKVVFPSKTLVAVGTTERFCPGMNLLMLRKFTFLRKSLVTKIASKHFLAGMPILVERKMGRSTKAFVAVRTLVRFFARVTPDVNVELRPSKESLLAEFADEILTRAMHEAPMVFVSIVCWKRLITLRADSLLILFVCSFFVMNGSLVCLQIPVSLE